jgi:hypothetical protein
VPRSTVAVRIKRGVAASLAPSPASCWPRFVVVREISSLEKFGLVEAASAQLNAGLLM